MLHSEKKLIPSLNIFSADRLTTANNTNKLFSCQPSQPTKSTEPLKPTEQEQKYLTRWRGTVTLEELLTDLQVRKVAFAKARSLGYIGQDAEDCFQLGSINLWQVLEKQPTLLCDKGAAWVGVWIAFSGSRRALWKHKARTIAFDEGISAHRSSRPERWAIWATRVDEQLDFAILMKTLAQQYDSNTMKLLALYSLTTSVKMKDVMQVAGAHKNQFIQVRNQVKNDMRALLEQDTETDVSNEFWVDCLQRGDRLESVTRVAERVIDNQRLLLALYIVTTSVKRKDVTDLFGIGLTAFRKEIIQIKLMLAEEYRHYLHKTLRY